MTRMLKDYFTFASQTYVIDNDCPLSFVVLQNWNIEPKLKTTLDLCIINGRGGRGNSGG